jgi:hypothetical protein
MSKKNYYVQVTPINELTRINAISETSFSVAGIPGPTRSSNLRVMCKSCVAVVRSDHNQIRKSAETMPLDGGTHGYKFDRPAPEVKQ